MQIRVWHLLSVIIVGAMTAFGPVKSMDWSWISTEMDAVKTGLSSWTTLFKSGQAAATSNKPVVQEVALTPKPAESTSNKPVVAPVLPAPVVPAPKVEAESAPVVPTVEAAADVKKPAARSRRHKKGKQTAVVAKRGRAKKTTPKPVDVGNETANVANAVPAPVASAASNNSEPLVGTYVALQLKSGREVKGVYQGRTATKYKIELPGMGPFEYDAANVIGVKPAE